MTTNPRRLPPEAEELILALPRGHLLLEHVRTSIAPDDEKAIRAYATRTYGDS